MRSAVEAFSVCPFHWKPHLGFVPTLLPSEKNALPCTDVFGYSHQNLFMFMFLICCSWNASENGFKRWVFVCKSLKKNIFNEGSTSQIFLGTDCDYLFEHLGMFRKCGWFKLAAWVLPPWRYPHLGPLCMTPATTLLKRIDFSHTMGIN